MCKAELQGYSFFYRIVCSKAKTHKIQSNKFRKFKAKYGPHLLMKENILSENSGVQDRSAVTTMPYVSLDITDKEAVEKVLTEQKPDVVVHCAAWTAVDLAEDDDKVEKVRAINAGGTENIAKVCKKLDSKMVYISTDYVFDGQGTEPWLPDCTDYKPLNVYGQTKLEGEQAVSGNLDQYFIVRIAYSFCFFICMHIIRLTPEKELNLPVLPGFVHLRIPCFFVNYFALYFLR